MTDIERRLMVLEGNLTAQAAVQSEQWHKLQATQEKMVAEITRLYRVVQALRKDIKQKAPERRGR